ncbi:hypothetical protein CIP107538_00705 [Corynebacterium diphtheriae]|uniref:hypothetical protein n=1 Tax=Corynebacterium diphtheriae TaxID=1717 RepID=UPI0013C668BE|nr:hypothetical protein [Corynebacterium diphtheriae]MBG9342032.1 hypothetical protein [Corynebacterium diphtheriae]CAB0592649.1 hypothetical protein CIP107538_00705 [Corynebacterium diphtheriae]CAB0683310.1 hypothetical protein FRC0032_00572 [Corynebacterium diphtheriae]CAB0720378.1 hypothetical protein FRC0086_00391 [Corynebacterium diphtheriae]CAB0806497.1 hypothetical protein FRC0292_00587 [Corynebacterium diphtheriae]
MRISGIIALVIGIVAVLGGYFLTGNNDVAGMLGGILMGVGGATTIGGLIAIAAPRPRMQ